MENEDSIYIQILHAFVVRNRLNMGLLDQNISSDVTNVFMRLKSDEEAWIANRAIVEDFSDTDSLVILFPAKPINGLTGQFALVLSVENIEPLAQGILGVRQVRMGKSRDGVSVSLDMNGSGFIDAKWAYARQPVLRKALSAMFDDPQQFVEAKTFDYIVLSGGLDGRFRSTQDWTIHTLALPEFQIKQSVSVDRCEELLEALNEQFSVNKDHEFDWLQSFLTIDRIDAAATDVENRLAREGKYLSFNIMLEFSDIELVRNKRLQPLVKRRITVVMENGIKRAGLIGISLNLSEATQSN